MNKKINEAEVVNKKIKSLIATCILFVVCCGLILYLCELYRVNDAEKKKIPVIQGLISEIYSKDLNHYVMDNQTTIVYICTANDEVCRSFERDFKKLLKTKDYSEQIVYLNLTDIDQDEFVKSFNENYSYKVKLTTKYPAFVLFEDGKVKSLLQENDKKLDIIKVKNFLELNKIGE